MNYFTALIKPASSLCNMRCKYCFYFDIAAHRETASYGIMNQQTAKALIEKAFSQAPPPSEVTFAFQGGEPTMAGLDFYKAFTALAERMKPEGVEIFYTLQTNGTLIDENWCRLFEKYHFLIGLSQDGPKRLHDSFRKNMQLGPTHPCTEEAVKLFRKHGISFNILTVVTAQAAAHPKELFAYYLEMEYPYVQLIPCLAPLDAKKSAPWDLTPRMYGRFLKEFFQLWYEALEKGRYVSVRLFDNLVWMLRGRKPEQCGLLGECRMQWVTEANGSVYPCDFYVFDPYRCGNFTENTPEEMLCSKGYQEFFKASENLPSLCSRCKVFPICRGGCRRYRSFFGQGPDYCPHQYFLYEVYPLLQKIAEEF